MELDKQAADRIIEALAPALDAELDRLGKEAYERAQLEFEQTRASVRDQITEELRAEFERSHQQSSDDLKVKFDAELHAAAEQWAAERNRLQNQIDEWRGLAEAQRSLSRCGSQSEILMRFLNLAAPFAPSVAVYVSKAERLALWKARGPASFPENISQTGVDPRLYFRPVAVRERIVAAVCAAEPCKRETLDFLAECLERSIEVFGLRLHVPTIQKANLA